MAKTFSLKSGAFAAMAASLAIAALPFEATAQDRYRGRWNADSQQGQSSPDDRGSGRHWRNDSSQQSAQQEAPRPRFRERSAQPQVTTENGPSWRTQRSNAPDTVTRSYRHDRFSRARLAEAQTPDGNDVSQEKPSRNGTYADPGRNRTYSDPDRNHSYQVRNGQDRDGDDDWRDADRHGWRDRDGDRNRDRDWNRNAWRDRWQDSHDRDQRRWDRDWRHDRRYDWRDYRNTHRYTYRMGRYYAPYWNYRYRRLSIGFYLDTLFFNSRYWIADPWAYRLPPAYGPYRWVRYYDDALLVDIYSGEVVDVIYDFFW